MICSLVLDVCISFQTVPKELQKKKTCIRIIDNTFLEDWQSILKDAELAQMHELKDNNNTIYSEVYNDFFRKINESIDHGIDINISRDLVQRFIEMENQLFHQRITKFIKVCMQPDIRDLRNCMRIIQTLLNDL